MLIKGLHRIAASKTARLPSCYHGQRTLSSSAPEAAPSSHLEQPALSPRWLSDAKLRIGKCIMFGMSSQQVQEAGTILKELATDWRELAAGSEGFLTARGRVGLQSQAVVWGEQDTMGHVNNIMYVRYAETGRTNWARNIGIHFDIAHKKQWAELLTNKGVGLILRSITVDFKFPMTWPDRISVYHKLRSRPDESTGAMYLDVMILSEVRQRPAARCLEDCVVYDYKNAKKSSLPPFMLEQFKKIFDLQEEAKGRNRQKAQVLLDRITRLEKQTWDRADAKEDFGGQRP